MTSTYEQFIAANYALMACYEKVSTEQSQAMSAHDLDQLCKTEQSAVTNFLKNDSITFKQLAAARLHAMEHQH
jgi:hypothetical protein